jgi:hypothetical protein
MLTIKIDERAIAGALRLAGRSARAATNDRNDRETAHILRMFADVVEGGICADHSGSVRDEEGWAVGEWQWDPNEKIEKIKPDAQDLHEAREAYCRKHNIGMDELLDREECDDKFVALLHRLAQRTKFYRSNFPGVTPRTEDIIDIDHCFTEAFKLLLGTIGRTFEMM